MNYSVIIYFYTLTCLCCTHGHGHIMSYDLTPGHGDESPYWIRDWDIREHDNTDETGTGQWFTADRRGWSVDAFTINIYYY